jgi:ribosomal protein S18 acetylase RimI-like enzyme
MEYTLSKATEKDIPAIVKMHGELADYHSQMETFWKNGKQTKAAFTKGIKATLKRRDYYYLVIKFDGETVGYFLSTISTRGKNVMAFPKIGNIWDGFLLPEHRGCGLAKIAVEETLRWFKSRKVAFVTLGVATKNRLGLRAWKGLGFKEYSKTLQREI